MTTTATRTKAPARVACPYCPYSAEPGSTIAGHVAMAHPDVPMDAIAPKRSAKRQPAFSYGADNVELTCLGCGAMFTATEPTAKAELHAHIAIEHADGSAMHERSTPTAAAEAKAVGAVLFRAHDAARHLENLLELEAPDPRVAELLRDAKRVRKSIAALLVDVAIADVEVPKEVSA